jgi:polar amino acid transport system permease protein
MSYDPAYLWLHLPALLRGLRLTLVISGVALVCSLLIGVLGAAMRYLKIPVASQCVAAYVEFIRNTPLLVQIFFVFFGLPAIGLGMSLFWSSVFALSVWGGAFHVESIRGGCASVQRGLTEAATALGLRRARMLRLIVLPLALRACLPSLLNTSISLLKNSALLQAVGVMELTFVAVDRMAVDFRVLEMFSALAVIYVALVLLLSLLSARLEARLSRPFQT